MFHFPSACWMYSAASNSHLILCFQMCRHWRLIVHGPSIIHSIDLEVQLKGRHSVRQSSRTLQQCLHTSSTCYLNVKAVQTESFWTSKRLIAHEVDNSFMCFWPRLETHLRILASSLLLTSAYAVTPVDPENFGHRTHQSTKCGPVRTDASWLSTTWRLERHTRKTWLLRTTSDLLLKYDEQARKGCGSTLSTRRQRQTSELQRTVFGKLVFMYNWGSHCSCAL